MSRGSVLPLVRHARQRPASARRAAPGVRLLHIGEDEVGWSHRRPVVRRRGATSSQLHLHLGRSRSQRTSQPVARSMAASPARKGRDPVQRIGIRAVATMVACLMAAAGLLAVVPQAASAATSAFTLTMTSGTLAVHGGSPTALPTPASIAGRVSSTTGDLSAATLTIPALHETHTGRVEQSGSSNRPVARVRDRSATTATSSTTTPCQSRCTSPRR